MIYITKTTGIAYVEFVQAGALCPVSPVYHMGDFIDNADRAHLYRNTL